MPVKKLTKADRDASMIGKVENKEDGYAQARCEGENNGSDKVNQKEGLADER